MFASSCITKAILIMSFRMFQNNNRVQTKIHDVLKVSVYLVKFSVSYLLDSIAFKALKCFKYIASCLHV